jgi:hypothetical protein
MSEIGAFPFHRQQARAILERLISQFEKAGTGFATQAELFDRDDEQVGKARCEARAQILRMVVDTLRHEIDGLANV